MLTNPVDERRSPRANVLLIAAVECGGVGIPIRVSNLSAHGVLVIGKALPCADTRVIFRCNGLAVESWVAWTEAPHAGIQFNEPIQPEELLRSRPVLSAAVVRDTRELDFRRPGFSGNQLRRRNAKCSSSGGRPSRALRGASEAQARARAVRSRIVGGGLTSAFHP